MWPFESYGCSNQTISPSICLAVIFLVRTWRFYLRYLVLCYMKMARWDTLNYCFSAPTPTWARVGGLCYRVGMSVRLSIRPSSISCMNFWMEYHRGLVMGSNERSWCVDVPFDNVFRNSAIGSQPNSAKMPKKKKKIRNMSLYGIEILDGRSRFPCINVRFDSFGETRHQKLAQNDHFFS